LHYIYIVLGRPLVPYGRVPGPAAKRSLGDRLWRSPWPPKGAMASGPVSKALAPAPVAAKPLEGQARLTVPSVQLIGI